MRSRQCYPLVISIFRHFSLSSLHNNIRLKLMTVLLPQKPQVINQTSQKERRNNSNIKIGKYYIGPKNRLQKGMCCSVTESRLKLIVFLKTNRRILWPLLNQNKRFFNCYIVFLI